MTANIRGYANVTDLTFGIRRIAAAATRVRGGNRERYSIGEPKEKDMKDSTKDQAHGKVHEVKGAVKEKAGRLTNNPGLEAEGQDEKLSGKIQKKVGQIEKVFEK